MKKTIKCPHCGERIRGYIVCSYTYRFYNPNTEKLGYISADWDHEINGNCPKCGGLITEDMFEEESE